MAGPQRVPSPAQRAAQPTLPDNPPPKPPVPPPVTGRPISRVKFAAFGPGEVGREMRPTRELSRAQAKLELHAMGVVVHGTHLVPWANIYWVEFEGAQ